ncbi:MAG: membrane protein insertion efficiency factor YidD [Candidatus Methanofishera endochildressiae]|uniref:Membrane protein insertion efficiency factor YidD n=1 Tax=Candidatus Methanofishera endochildressiae TaxID=2738884 RepID=A0A7Z0MP70_9GAMM|nr:membrane protein insertion efficiency factor YidD [Candidatus Methanofishera endochildressiae]
MKKDGNILKTYDNLDLPVAMETYQIYISNSRITEEQCRYNKTCSTCRLDVEDEFHFSVICP